MSKRNYMGRAINFIKDVFIRFSKSNTLQEGAALAYYSVFSILPMVIIVTSIFGLLWGEKSVSGEVYTELSNVLGNDGALEIQGIIKNQHTQYNNVLTAAIGFLTLALSSTGMFNQLHSSFNNIWNISSKPRNGFVAYLSKHFVSFSILIILFFILTMSVSVNSLLIKCSNTSSIDFSISIFLEHLVSFFLISLMFSLMFKFIGDAKVNWRISLAGGAFTSALFLLGKYVIGLYIGHSNISSTFGSASMLALLMIWVYYTSQIIFIGAIFTYTLGERIGRPILPSKDAINIAINEIVE